MHQFAAFFQIYRRFIASGHPTTNCQEERFVQFVKDKLKKMANEPEIVEKKTTINLLQISNNVDNDKTSSQMVFGEIIRNCFDLLQPKQSVKSNTLKPCVRMFNLEELVQSRNYQFSNI